MRNRLPFMALLGLLSISAATASASIIDGALDPSIDDSFNQIADPTNQSDGLLFFDLGLTLGLTQSEALAAAQAILPTAAVATASQFADVFLAAGVSPSASAQLTQGFDPGDTLVVGSTGFTVADVVAFEAIVGLNNAIGFTVFTDPDGSADLASTRDTVLFFGGSGGQITFNQATELSSPTISHLIVVAETADPGDPAAIPEPVSFMVWAGLAGVVGLQAQRRVRRR